MLFRSPATDGAIVLVTLIATVTFLFLGSILNPARTGANGLQTAQGVDFAAIGQSQPPGHKALRIHVNGQQYIWRYDYVGEKPITEGRTDNGDAVAVGLAALASGLAVGEWIGGDDAHATEVLGESVLLTEEIGRASCRERVSLNV